MITVMFSGGCDSTLVLYKTLMSIQKKEISNTVVNALTIINNQVPAQKEQLEARIKIIEEFKKRELFFNHINVHINADGHGIQPGEPYGMVQPSIWLTQAPLYISNNEILRMGYHEGDSFWTHRHYAEEGFKNICKVMEKNCIIEYPLKLKRKPEIIMELKKRGLYELCWYCEHPTIDSKPCGECFPCQTHRTALWQNETFKSDAPIICNSDDSDVKIEDYEKEDYKKESEIITGS